LIKVITIQDDSFGENTYLIIKDSELFVVDPGFDYGKIKGAIEETGLVVSKVFLTHGHYDHTYSLANFLPSIIYAHESEKELLFNPEMNLSSFTGKNLSTKDINFYSGLFNKIGDFEIYLTPGHTAGCVILKIENCLFTGDTLFLDTVGRTDLPTGNPKQLKESLKTFDRFDRQIMAYPGHGDAFKLEEAYRINYFLKR
jgi:glyoxylase-like metal-dependent hydrolase (beta-lactamase superfamily II)